MISPNVVVEGLTSIEVTFPGTILIEKKGTVYSGECLAGQLMELVNLLSTLVCSCCSCDTWPSSNGSNSPNLHFIHSTWFEYRCSVLSLCSSPLYSFTPITK